jgi:hypothetical protein
MEWGSTLWHSEEYILKWMYFKLLGAPLWRIMLVGSAIILWPHRSNRQWMHQLIGLEIFCLQRFSLTPNLTGFILKIVKKQQKFKILDYHKWKDTKWAILNQIRNTRMILVSWTTPGQPATNLIQPFGQSRSTRQSDILRTLTHYDALLRYDPASLN